MPDFVKPDAIVFNPLDRDHVNPVYRRIRKNFASGDYPKINPVLSAYLGEVIGKQKCFLGGQ
jgi:hypothetical protein